MRKQPKSKTTGEVTRSFIKHKVYGTVYAIEGDDAGTVLASAVVTEATACRHTLPTLELTLDDVDQVNANIRDYEIFEPVCSDPKHLLDEIGLQERACQAAESAMVHARASAKAAKEIFEQEKAKLRTMVREATNPAPLPLFDAPDAPAAAEPIAAFYVDGVGVKRCSVCMAEYPCGVDHSVPPAPPADPPRPSAG